MTADEKISVGWYLCLAGTGDFWLLGDYWTAVGTSDRLFCFIQTENITHLE